MEKLSPKHRLFVEAYDGDEVFAMRAAGFTGADNYLKKRAADLLALPLIQEAIRDRSLYTAKTAAIIATREERQALWTAIMKNEDPYKKEELDQNGIPIPDGNIPLMTRLKASEMLGKSEADFVDKVDMTATHTISDLISKSYLVEDDIDAIEATYKLLKEKKELPTIEFPEAPVESLEDLI